MGWRAQDEYDKAARERDREFVASPSLGERIRFRLWQAAWVGILVCIVALFVLLAVEARGAPIESGRIEVIDTAGAFSRPRATLSFRHAPPSRPARRSPASKAKARPSRPGPDAG